MIKVVFLKQAEKEMNDLPNDLRLNVISLLEELELGQKLSMPISRPLYSIVKGLNELRLSNKIGECRVFYWIRWHGMIYVIHILMKKTQILDNRTRSLLIQRIRNIEK